MKHAVRWLPLEHFSEVIYQLVFLVITITVLSLLLYKPVTEFHPVGNSPIIYPVTDAVTAQWHQKPAIVKTGMHIADFLRFDTVKNEFIINAFIWFSFDPQVVSPKIIDTFYFTKGEILQKSPATIKQRPGHAESIALYTVRIQFSTILDYSRFPLDDHRIFLNLANYNASAQEIIYQVAPDDYLISDNIYIAGWDVVGHQAAAGYSPLPLGKDMVMNQTKTVFSLDLSKGDLRQLSLILLPLLFLFYLGLFAFSIRDIGVALSLPLASASGLLAYSFVIQTLAPAVGYMMLSDYLFVFFLFSIFIIFFVRALAAIPEHIVTRLTLKKIEGITIIGLQLALIIIWYLLVDIRGI